MLLLDCQAIVVTDGVESRCISRAALTNGEENHKVSQSEEVRHGFV